MYLLRQKPHSKGKAKFGLWHVFIGVCTCSILFWFLWPNKNGNRKTIELTVDTVEVDTNNGTLKIMTWNLQGLLQNELTKRTDAVVAEILKDMPDAMFFQELIPTTYLQLQKSLGHNYDAVLGVEKMQGYFTGIFYRKNRFVFESSEVTKYKNTVMERTLLTVKLSLEKIKFAFLTTHLESLPRFRELRIEQLKECFKVCNDFPAEYNVIFGGDLNLEIDEENGMVPTNIKDLWQECGSESSKYTWDTEINRNDMVYDKMMTVSDDERNPKRRYDRLYLRSAVPPTLHLKSFEFRGTSQVGRTKYFPSDHWALLSTFQMQMETDLKTENRSTRTDRFCKTA